MGRLIGRVGFEPTTFMSKRYDLIKWITFGDSSSNINSGRTNNIDIRISSISSKNINDISLISTKGDNINNIRTSISGSNVIGSCLVSVLIRNALESFE